jgi:hypothetical protein
MEELMTVFKNEENQAVLFNLMIIKKINERFEHERKMIRAAFLLRGICEKEVDDLLEDRGLYETWYVPPHLRWEVFQHAGEQTIQSVFQQAMKELPYNKFKHVSECITAKKLTEWVHWLNGKFAPYSLHKIEKAYELYEERN